MGVVNVGHARRGPVGLLRARDQTAGPHVELLALPLRDRRVGNDPREARLVGPEHVGHAPQDARQRAAELQLAIECVHVPLLRDDLPGVVRRVRRQADRVVRGLALCRVGHLAHPRGWWAAHVLDRGLQHEPVGQERALDDRRGDSPLPAQCVEQVIPAPVGIPVDDHEVGTALADEGVPDLDVAQVDRAHGHGRGSGPVRAVEHRDGAAFVRPELRQGVRTDSPERARIVLGPRSGPGFQQVVGEGTGELLAEPVEEPRPRREERHLEVHPIDGGNRIDQGAL